MDLAKISSALERGTDGVWRPSVASSQAISFPENGYAECFALEDSSFWFAHRNELLSIALRRFPIDGAFIDIGGGNGVVSKRLTADGLEAVLIEPGAEGAHNARKRGLPNVICATLDDAKLGEASFGGAGLFDVIEHVEDDAALLHSTRRILRPGGVLAVTVPAYQWLWSAEDEMAGHFRRYDIAQLDAVLARAGFETQYASYFFAALTPPIFVLRSLRHRFAPRSNADVERAAATHHTPSALSRHTMNVLLGPELRAVRAGRSIPFGSSILAIARAV